ncbi:MAG: sulfotransferase family protein [Aeromicrobium sp.]
MTLPNFLFLGPDKCGSTWLHDVLSTHPQVHLTPAKDTYFFDREFNRGLPWYERQFSGARPEHLVVGEICHDYLFDETAADRIAELLPDAKLMVCLRDPAERAFSAYLNLTRHGQFDGTFEDALSTVPELLDHGRYGLHVQRYLDRFDRGQVFVAQFDDLQADPQRFLDTVTQFLGISRLALTDELAMPARGAAAARSQLVATFVKRVAMVAREAGLVGIIGRIKASRTVRRALYRELGDSAPSPSDSAVAVIRSRLHDDIAHVSRLLDEDLFARWRWS